MNIIIQTPDFKATKKLERFVYKQFEKLFVVNDKITAARVCLKIERSGKNKSKFCEAKLTIPGNDLFAEKQTDSFEESIMKTVSALKHQSTRLKTLREKQRSGSASLARG